MCAHADGSVMYLHRAARDCVKNATANQVHACFILIVSKPCAVLGSWSVVLIIVNNDPIEPACVIYIQNINR